MKTWQWILLISLTVAFLALLASPLLMPVGWSIAPMMGRGYGYWGEVYSPWGMSWPFISLRFLYWVLPIAAVALLTMLFLNRQHHRLVPEPVDEN